MFTFTHLLQQLLLHNLLLLHLNEERIHFGDKSKNNQRKIGLFTGGK